MSSPNIAGWRASRRRWIRLGSSAALLIAAAWAGWRLWDAHARISPIDNLAQMDAYVYRPQRTWVGHAIEQLPNGLQACLPRLLQPDVLGPPKSIMATEVESQDVDGLIVALRELPSVEWIVLMENQLPDADLARVRKELPKIEVVEAAFVSGVVYSR